MKLDLIENAEKDIWMIYDTLRGALEVEKVKNYLMPMVTLKCLSENEDHGFLIPGNAVWGTVSASGVDFGEKLNVAFRELEQANDTLQGVFTLTDYTAFDDRNLFTVADTILNRYSFNRRGHHDPDPLTGTLARYVDMIWDFAISREGVAGGEISSPNSISILLPQLLNKINGTVCDTAAGINDFLIASYKYARQHGGSVKLYGQEIHPQTRALGIMNLIIHGLYPESADIKGGNTITDPAWIEDRQLMKFDGIMSNPPFHMSNWGHEAAKQDVYGRFRYGIPSKSYGDMAFVLHSLASLKQDGKAAIVIPHGVLFRGASEGNIRAELIRENFIEAVIGLPANLFLGTGIPVAVLILNKSKDEALRNKILLINAEEGFAKQSRNQNVLRESDIEKIVDTYRGRKEIEQYSRVVSFEEVADNEFNLLPLRYFEKAELATKIGRVEINRKNYEDLKLVKLKNIADVSRGYGAVKAEEDEEEFTHYLVNLSDVQEGKIQPDGLMRVTLDSKKAKDYELDPGDILLSSRGTAMKVAVVTESDMREKPFVFSQNFLRIRVSSMSDPFFIKAFLESPLGQYYLETFQKGTTVTVLSHKDVSEIPLPLPTLQQQQQIATQMRNADQAYQEALQAAKREHEQNYLEGYRMMGIADSFTLVE